MTKLTGISAILAFLTAIASVTGCSTNSAPPTAYTLEKKDESYTEKLQRVVLVLSSKTESGRPNVLPLLAGKLHSKGIEVSIVIVDPLELNKGESVRKAIQKLAATHVLTIQPTSMTKKTTSGQYVRNIDVSMTFESSIYAVEARKVIWRGSTVLSYTRETPNEREEAVATSIIKKLTADKLI